MLELHRKRERRAEPAAAHELSWPRLAECGPAPDYEYQVLVTSLSEDRLSIADLYRQRADAENVSDELKNPWGWGGVHDEGPTALPAGDPKTVGRKNRPNQTQRRDSNPPRRRSVSPTAVLGSSVIRPWLKNAGG